MRSREEIYDEIGEELCSEDYTTEEVYLPAILDVLLDIRDNIPVKLKVRE